MTSKNNKKRFDTDSLEVEYKAIYPLANTFCLEVSKQIDQLLVSGNVILGFPIQSRVKTWDSIVEKLDRLDLDIRSVKEIQDIIGLRIILLFQRDIDKVCSLISNNFNIIRQYDTRERLSEDQFGYSSIHFVIELPKKWLTVPTLIPLRGLRAEIQLRTLAQHIWAESSHILQYKHEHSVPRKILRSIYRVSALLETVDLEFERVLQEREEYRSDVDISGTDDQLNVDLLEKTLDCYLPRQNKSSTESYSELLNDLSKYKINSQKDLVNLINRNIERVLEDDKNLVEEKLKDIETGIPVLGTSTERTKAGVFYTHVGLIRRTLYHEYGARFKRTIK